MGDTFLCTLTISTVPLPATSNYPWLTDMFSTPLLSSPPELGFIGSGPAGVIPAPTPGKLVCVVIEKIVCKLLYHTARLQL